MRLHGMIISKRDLTKMVNIDELKKALNNREERSLTKREQWNRLLMDIALSNSKSIAKDS